MIKAIGISGSLRKASSNSGLLRHAQSVMPAGMSLDLLEIGDIPFYNQDLVDEGRPAAVEVMLRKIGAADALVLATPEYNHTMAPALKNVLDWASREPDNRLLDGKPVAIMGAGGGMGTARAQNHLRQICVVMNLLPINKPEVLVNAYGGGFDAEGNLIDVAIGGKLREQMAALLDWTLRLQGLMLPMVKAA